MNEVERCDRCGESLYKCLDVNACERRALTRDLATARRDQDLARGLIARLGDLDALESLAAVNESLKARVEELESDFARRQASHCCPAWDDQAGQCDCDERMGKLIEHADRAEVVVRELRQKLAIAGVEGSPPPGEDTTIGALVARADRAEAQVATLREALSKHCRGIVSIPCSMCHDSTWDHECDSREEPCPHCAALAATEPKGGAT